MGERTGVDDRNMLLCSTAGMCILDMFPDVELEAAFHHSVGAQVGGADVKTETSLSVAPRAFQMCYKKQAKMSKLRLLIQTVDDSQTHYIPIELGITCVGGELMVVIHDVTADIARESAEAKRQKNLSDEASRTKRMLNYLSHECRNFFFPARLALQSLRRALPELAGHNETQVTQVTDDMTTIMNMVSDSVEDCLYRSSLSAKPKRCSQHANMSEIFDAVLTMHKMQTDEQRYDHRPTDLLRDVVADAENFGRAAAKDENHAAFSCVVDPSVQAMSQLLLASRIHLVQVLTNTLSNAFKFCPPKAARGVVTLGVRVASLADYHAAGGLSSDQTGRASCRRRGFTSG